MLRYVILFFIATLSIVGANAENTEDSNREAFREAWRRYTEQVDQQNYEASLIDAQRVFELSELLYPDHHEQIAAATFNYGDNLLWVGRLKESAKILKLALKRFEHLYGNDGPELIPVLLSMAEASATPPKYRPRQRLLDRAHKIATNNFDHSSIEYADKLLDIVDVSYFYPPSVATGEDLRKAHEIYLANLEPSAIMVGEAAYLLGVYHARREEFEEAEQFLMEAMEIFDPSDTNLRNTHIEMRQYMVWILEGRGMREEATIHLLAIGKLFESNPELSNTLPIARVAPYYPASALRAGQTGYVDLRFMVDEKGYAIDPEVVKVSGSESFRKAALLALQKFRYVPRFVDGKAVAQEGIKTRITFEIKN